MILQALAAVNAKDDPVCKLDYGRRLRVCNSIFKKFIWAPFQVKVEEGCELIQFSLMNEEAQFHEWTILCRTTGFLRFRHRVSRSYSDNEIFVFDYGARGIKLSACFNNIGVIKDKANSIVSVRNDGAGPSGTQP